MKTKMKRVSHSALKEMSKMVVIWKPETFESDDKWWRVSEFGVYKEWCPMIEKTEVRLRLSSSGNNHSDSFEEAMVKAHILFLGSRLFIINALGEEFSPPCGYDITGKGVNVFEVTP